MVMLLKDLKWSPDGCRIETLPAGEHEDMPPRALEIADQLGILSAIEGGEKKRDADQQPEQPEQPAPQKSKK